MSLQFRIRTPDGTQQILKNILPNHTLRQLQQEIGKLLSKPAPTIQIKYVFPPPRILEISDETLSSLKITSGNIIVDYITPPLQKLKPEEKKEEIQQKTSIQQFQQSQQSQPSNQTQPSNFIGNSNQANKNDRILIRKEIPSDNSCLFTGIGYLCESRSMNKAEELRQIIASIVMSDPETYNEGILGLSNEKYCSTIMNPNMWGGSIELSILSKYYEKEIVAIDVVTLKPHIFGENNHYKERIYLLYDGIHYDALVMVPYLNAPESMHQLIFPSNDESVFVQAVSLAHDFHQSKQYTDVYNFTLKCVQCGVSLKGQEDAQAHAEKTGHIRFEEYHSK